MKKVGILAFSGQETGGVLQYTQSIIDVFETIDEIEVVIFTLNKDIFDIDSAELRVISKPKRNWIKRIIIFIQCLLVNRNSFLLSNYEIKVFSDIDLFFNPSPSLYPNFFLNKPFIFTVQDFQERYYPEFFSKFDRFNRWLVKRALAKTSSRIICESSNVKDDALKFLKINDNDIKIIASPPTKTLSSKPLKDNSLRRVKQKYNLPDQYLFYPAQFWEHKNHIRLVYAFEKISKNHDNLFLVLTGVKANNYSNIFQKIKSLGIESKVLHLGYVDYDDLAYIYKSSKMLIMPTLFESISIPIYEAFALGVPVCCSNILSLPEQTNGAALMFDPFKVDDIVNQTELLLSSSDLQIELGIKGKQIMDEFDFASYKKNFIGVISSLL